MRNLLIGLTLFTSFSASAVENGFSTKDFPEVVLIKFKNFSQIGNSGSCTGVYLNGKTILTAKHCVANDKNIPLNEYAIIKDSLGKRSRVKYTNFIVHPNADIALIFLKNDTKLNIEINIGTEAYEGLDATIVGFAGTTNKKLGFNNIENVSNNLLVIRPQFDKAYTLDPLHSALSQPGDSGGPLFSGYLQGDETSKTLIGITHRGGGFIKQSSFVNIYTYREWILKYLKH